MCDYCKKERGNTPLVERGSRIVEIEKANERTWGIFMRWRTQNGKLHMEWNSIGFCPYCGRELRGKTLGEEKAGKKSPPEGEPGPCGQPSDDIIHNATTLDGIGSEVSSEVCGKLTVEQVRKAVERNAIPIPSPGCRWQFIDHSYEAIADELNAALSDGECEIKTDSHELEIIASSPEDTWAYKCSACYWPFRYDRGIKPNFCPNCGKKVKR